MELREHQRSFEAVINGIISGRNIKRIYAYVVPGGGKSMLPLLAGRLISAAGLADAICWVTPRLSLCYQAETNFTEIGFSKLFRQNLSIRVSTNEVNPCRGLQGFTTTFNAIGVDDKKTILQDFLNKRYIHILDEGHHVRVDSLWEKALQPLVEQAKYFIFLSGTMARGDGERIAFVKYDRQDSNLYPQIQSDETTAVIEYTRRTALLEKAILPLSFRLSSGSAKWINKEGSLLETSIASANRKIASQAIFTAISTGFAESLLEKGVQHWQELKQHNKGAKLLVVTANYEEAKKITKILKDKWLNSEIATSHESKQALQAIKRFKNNTVDILVTIAMAYEGLDVPGITHIICLTNIRSTPWIEQMVARAVRVDQNAGAYESQIATIFAPDDIFFREIVSKIEHEQRPFVKARPKTQTELFNPDNDGGGEQPLQIQPLSSNLAGNREIFLGGKRVSSDMVAPQTPSEIETSLRKRIEGHIRQFSFINRYNPKRLNSEIKSYFEKPRDRMAIPELSGVLAYVERMYPLGQQIAVDNKGQAAQRGCGGRTPTKAVPWP